MRKAFAMGFVFAALLTIGVPAQATNLVLNGSFEINGGNGQINGSTTLADWTVPGTANTSYTFLYAPGTADTTGAYTPEFGQQILLWGPNDGSNNGLTPISPDGGYFVGQDSDFQQSPIQQTINGLTAGDTYQVGFWWAAAQQYGFTGPTVSQWQVSFGSQTQTTAAFDLPSQAFSGWMYQTFNFTADGPSDLLSFFALGSPQGPPPFALLDGVSVTPTPEPGTLPLLLTGLMSGLGVLRSKKWLKR
jgi:hypothetical protein